MNLLLKKIKYLLQWTTLYTVGSDNRFNPPEIILKSFRKKTWYVNNSRKYAFRYMFYFIYFLLFGIITILAVSDRDVFYKILALSGGVYLFINFFMLLVRFMFLVITSPGETSKYKLEERIRFIVLSPVIFFIAWSFSALVYFAFFTPIFVVIFTILSFILGENSSIVLSTTASHAGVSVLQYWSRRREIAKK